MSINNFSNPPQMQTFTVPPLQMQQNRIPITSTYTPRPVSSVNVPPLRQSLPLSQSQIMEIPKGKHVNKFSFKRNSTTRSKVVSFTNRNSAEVTAAITKQEDLLNRIRTLAVTRRGTIQTASKTAEGVTLWNTLTQMHNLTLTGQSSQLQPLQFLPEFSQNQTQIQRYPQQPIFSKVGMRPVEFVQANPALQFTQRVQNEKALGRPRVQEAKIQFVPVGLPTLSAGNNSSQLYTLQIRELRSKIQALEQQKSTLNDRIHTLEQNANFTHSQVTIEHYRSQIGSLREQISRLSESYHPATQENELNELREGVKQLSEAVRQYEDQLVQAHNHINFLQHSRNEDAAAMQAEVLALQRAISEHATQVENKEAILQQQLNSERAEHLQCQELLMKAREEIIILKNSVVLGGKFDEVNLKNNDYSSDLKEQITKLNLELNQAQQNYNQCHQNLAKAQDYIIQLQKSGETVHSQFDNQLKRLQEENERLLTELYTVKDDLNTARAEAEILIAKAATAATEYDDMQLRYRQTVQSLNARYDQMLDQRNSLTAKLSASQSLPHPTTVGNEEADALRQSLQQLTARVNQSREHLLTAESYIEQNMQNWEAANLLKEEHSRQQAFIAAINADLENTRKQNIELGQRIQEFERMVTQTERLRTENEQLTIVIRQKDNAQVSTSLKQIDETQIALDNYTVLYREAEAREKSLQQENERMRGQLAKIGQMEQYLARAQNFILEQEGKMTQTITNFEKENGELKEHLFKAEEYILSLQQSTERHNEALLQLQQSRNAQKKRADTLHEGLVRAQNYIFEVEKKINKN